MSGGEDLKNKLFCKKVGISRSTSSNAATMDLVKDNLNTCIGCYPPTWKTLETIQPPAHCLSAELNSGRSSIEIKGMGALVQI